MATGIISYLHLWLLVLLCWFVLLGNQVTQESYPITQDVFSDKAHFTSIHQEPTPHLVSSVYTESSIFDHIDLTSLVVRPAIAPATPWEDTKILSSTTDHVSDGESERHVNNKEEITEPINERLSETFSEEVIAESKKDNDEEFQKRRAKIMDLHGNSIDDFDLGQPTEDKGSISGMEDVQGDHIHDIDEDKSDQKLDDIDHDQESTVNEFDQVKQMQGFSIENAPAEASSTKDQVTYSNEVAGENAEESQASDGDEDLLGSREDVDGPREDMPSFKEWSQKFLEQEEQKNKEQQNSEKGSSESSSHTKKKKSDRKQNNYASVDCGAKILEKNPEAQNAESILLENKDLYMLNPCSANVWFIVELCDHAQVTSLQIANFEMFSSTTEKFQVSFSTRYPTREWTQLQTFIAKPEKSVQTFALDPIFAKYIKVEQLSHHGSEHYCPWSLLRVYGNSMVEEYEEHESSSQSTDPGIEDDESVSSDDTKDKQEAKGILKSATDAVINFVKETAKKLVPREDARNSSSPNQANYQTDYTDESSGQEPPESSTLKTIVQLVHREDFEAGCEEVGDEISSGENQKCLSKSTCGSSKHRAQSYQMFLEIIHHVCRRDPRTVEACLSIVTRTLAANKSAEVSEVRVNQSGSGLDSDKINEDKKGESVSKVEASRSNGLPMMTSSTVRDSLEATKGVETLDLSPPNSASFPQSSSTFKSVDVRVTESAEDIPVSSSVIANSGSNDSGSSSLIPDESNGMKTPLSPSPLMQPPLAVNEGAEFKEPPTQPTTGDIEEERVHQGDSVVSSVMSCATKASDSLSTSPSSSRSSVRDHVTPYDVGTVSSEGISSVFGQNVSPSSPVSTASVEDGTGGEALRQEKQEDDEGLEGLMKGGLEEKPNPHVDVLKITLTDEETKEGTAEPEQSTETDREVSDGPGGETRENVVENDIQESVETVEPAGKNEASSGFSGSEVAEANAVSGTVEDEANVNGVPGAPVEEKDPPVRLTAPSESVQPDTVAEEKGVEKQDVLVKMGADVGNNMLEANDQYVGQHLVKNVPPTVSEAMCEKKENEDSTLLEESKNTHEQKRLVEEANHDSHGGATDSAPTISASSGQANGKKESIFVAMSRKIKALEQNVTMTNLYLEELSQRYRKSLEEMQKKFEKKLVATSKTSKLLTKVNLSQNSTILVLTSRLVKLEQKLEEATSRLKVVNEEVVERHVLGMCLQFVIVILLWLILGRARNAADTRPVCVQQQTDSKPGKKKRSVFAVGEHRVHENGGVVEDIAQDKKYLDDIALPKSSTPDAITEGKRRRKRRNRVSNETCGHDPEHGGNHSQNIVSKTAGLLFRSPDSHEAEETTRYVAKDVAQRSCSADSLNDFARANDDHKTNFKRQAVSPKSKKALFRNGGKTDNGFSRTRPASCHSDGGKIDVAKELNRHAPERLLRSKSSSWQVGKTSLYKESSSCDRNTSACFFETANDRDRLKNQKSSWIW